FRHELFLQVFRNDMKRRSMAKKTTARRIISPKKKVKTAPSPTPERLIQFVWGFAPTLVLDSAVRLRLFDYLADKPGTVDELAWKTEWSARGLKALLDALVGWQFLKRKGNRYSLTPESSAFLVSTRPDYHGGFLEHITRQIMPSWMNLIESVRT